MCCARGYGQCYAGAVGSFITVPAAESAAARPPPAGSAGLDCSLSPGAVPQLRTEALPPVRITPHREGKVFCDVVERSRSFSVGSRRDLFQRLAKPSAPTPRGPTFRRSHRAARFPRSRPSHPWDRLAFICLSAPGGAVGDQTIGCIGLHMHWSSRFSPRRLLSCLISAGRPQAELLE